MSLTTLRSQINELDAQLLSILESRMNLSVQVAKLKTVENLPIFDPKREQEIITTLCQKASLKSNLDENLVKELYAVILKHSKLLQQKTIKN